MIYHKPVLLEECIRGLNIKPKGIYVDLTFGGGGHSLRILEELDEDGRLLAFDQDIDAQRNILPDKRLIFIHSNFRFLRNFLRYYNYEKVDGVLADLGISSHQIDTNERGFMHREDAALDMRMNTVNELTAAKILNEYSVEKLAELFRNYGEIQGAGRFARKIGEMRKTKAITTSGELIEGLGSLLPERQRSKLLSKLFQALRMEVNDELGALKEMLVQIPDSLKPGGRFVVMSYHSIEDRLVKNFIKAGNLEGNIEKDFFGNVLNTMSAISKNVIVSGEKELAENPRARSAKLRIAEKK
ncbi:MAG: 16S rRNA (cytosine(1402)-N(4))-methyltransferase RsmH [Bacteroidales bacterium]|nr:16S rRNA (cytosine(1402)-N(4))-methyltransferase RsmH [Bacteroidales bacterium]MCF8391564.1 16S rRNA (cytosine(1402)-N(4))-methyltransferase RsmH [Bacteroidales bacterium]